MKKRGAVALSLLLGIVGCGKLDPQVAGVKTVPSIKSIPRYTGSLEASTRTLIDNKQAQVFQVERALLGQTLIWSAWIEKSDRSIYPGLPHGHSTTPQLVFLQLSPDQTQVHLFLRATTSGGVSTQAELVDRFPVVEVSDRSVTFDFSKGLPHRWLSTWMKGEVTKQTIEYSFVYDFQNSQKLVTFAQLAILDDEKHSNFVLRHSFRVYEENDPFKRVAASQALKFGVFPASDFSETTQPVVLRRANPAKPVVWHISSNTPAEYREAIAQGLRWWNAAFKREQIIVKQLEEPVDWATARMNVFQWSDDPSFCGSALAFGPSDANPVTGEIYTAKVLFCGPAFWSLYAAGIEQNTYSEEEFRQRTLRWAAAHEVGHTLGFAHNFYGKYYQGAKDLQNNSTVMDYPHPMDIMNYSRVGDKDLALVDYLYINEGSEESAKAVRAFPACTDEEAGFDPKCTHFIKGQENLEALVENYVERLEAGKSLKIERFVRGALHKLFLTGKLDSSYLERRTFAALVNVYGAEALKVYAGELISAEKAARTQLLSQSSEYRAIVYDLFSRLVEGEILPSMLPDFSTAQGVIEMFKAHGDFQAYQWLSGIKLSADREAAGSNDAVRKTYFFRLAHFATQALDTFWER